jgi:hypothetical protein
MCCWLQIACFAMGHNFQGARFTLTWERTWSQLGQYVVLNGSPLNVLWFKGLHAVERRKGAGWQVVGGVMVNVISSEPLMALVTVKPWVVCMLQVGGVFWVAQIKGL